jgi:hypothetical protein
MEEALLITLAAIVKATRNALERHELNPHRPTTEECRMTETPHAVKKPPEFGGFRCHACGALFVF